jgi:hypothetical protein
MLAENEMAKRQIKISELQSAKSGARTGWLCAGNTIASPESAFFPQVWVERARRRVGETAIDQLRWLCVFARGSREEVLKNLSLGLGSILAHELFLFACFRDFRSVIEKPDAIADIAATLEEGLRSIVERGHWEMSLPSEVICTLSRISGERSRGDSDGFKCEYRAGSPGAAILLRAKELVQAEGARLSICAARKCNKLFVKKKRGRFCSQQCSQREHVRVWRAKHPVQASDRWHENYLRRVRKENPAAAARIARRPRKETIK